MSRQLSLYLQDILNSIEKIKVYSKNLDYEELITDTKTLDAITHNLLIIGESVKQIPEHLRSKYPQITWKEIAGLRDIIAHAYFTLNPRIIWNIIKQDLKSLQDCIKLIQETES